MTQQKKKNKHKKEHKVHKVKARPKVMPQQGVNWFGINPNQTSPSRVNPRSKPRPNHNSFSYLGLNNVNRNTQPVSFLGLHNSSTTSHTSKRKALPYRVNFLGLAPHKKEKPLYRKESVKSKHLSKWGDADMDGSPNYFDCDARNWLKDQQDPAVQQAEAQSMKGNDAQDILTQVAKKDAAFAAATAPPIMEGLKDAANTRKRRVTKEYIQTGIKKGLNLAGEKITNKFSAKGMKEYGARSYEGGFVAGVKELFGKQKRGTAAEEELRRSKQDVAEKKRALVASKGTMSEESYSKGLKEIAAMEAPIIAHEGKMAAAEKGYAKYREAIETPGLAGKIKLAQLKIDEKKAAGKIPTSKEIGALVKAEKKVKLFGEKGKNVLVRVPGGGTLLTVTGANLGAGGVYSKEQRAKSARVRRMTATASGLLFGPNLTRSGMGATFGSEPRGRGRPAGPSGEYRIGGRPVYEGEFREWEAKQGALNRMLPSEAQSATLNPEYIDYLKRKQEQERMPQQKAVATQQMTQQGQQRQPQAGMGNPSTQEQNMQGQDMEYDTQQTQEGEYVDQAGIIDTPEDMQLHMPEAPGAPRREYMRSTPEEIRQAQYAAQQQDEILNAPNFMKGELKAAGGGLLTPVGPQIMDAPNAFKGEMRNVTQKSDLGEIHLSERPQTNPYSDTYVDIELGSGKPVVRQRPREKWATGEAL